MPSAEILAVLADEVSEAGSSVAEALVRLGQAGDEAAFREAFADYAEQVQRITAVANALNLDGLTRVCDFVDRNLSALAPGQLDSQRRALFERWPRLVFGYLKAPRDGVYSREIAESFRAQAWPLPLDDSGAAELEEALLALGEMEDTSIAGQPARQSEARPEDVVLEIPGDVNQKLVDAFLTEGPQQIGEYSALIQGIARGEGWADEINECRRLIHSVKGAANTVGVRGVAVLCHHVEDILEYLFENAVQPEPELGKLLVKVADTLEEMFEALLASGQPPADAQLVLQNVLDWINRMERGEYAESSSGGPTPGGSGDGDAEPAGDEPAVHAAALPAEPAASSAPVTASLTPAKERQAESGAAANKPEPKVRVDVRTIDNLLRASGEMAISGGHVHERLQQTFKVLAELRERHTSLLDRSNEMEGFVTTQGIAAGRRQALAAASDTQMSGFDALEMDQYSEMHTYVHGLLETVSDLQLLSTRLADALTAADTAVNVQAQLNRELHELLMTSRMIPAGSLESRVQRVARQAAEKCGKQVTLRLRGAEVMLDEQMVNALTDPIQHLIRNAVDHGLENSDVRAAIGKPQAGDIQLTFARDGNYLVVTCSDDGAGLDLARIHARAVEMSLVAEEQTLDEDEIARLILHPGFSTSSTVTEVSGRGVGMDVVHTGVARLKGSIGIRTLPGVGTTFTLRVPMSLGIAHCLLVAAGNQTYAITSDNLEQIVYNGVRSVQATGDGALHYDDGTVQCEAHMLARLVGFAVDVSEKRDVGHVILVNDIGGKLAIVVDSVLGGRDLVIKNLGRYLTGIRGVIGASILGDGLVVPILDVAELVHSEAEAPLAEPAVAGEAHTSASTGDILVVDDSLSVRTALSVLLEGEGFRVRMAKDGVEAIEAIGERLPAAVLADLEMPRMNGIELTAHIRNNAATRALPVIMVTSRTAEKHRKLAQAAGVNEYITKPYREHDLLQCLKTALGEAA